jgi:hypothetical protein
MKIRDDIDAIEAVLSLSWRAEFQFPLCEIGISISREGDLNESSRKSDSFKSLHNCKMAIPPHFPALLDLVGSKACAHAPSLWPKPPANFKKLIFGLAPNFRSDKLSNP